MPPLHSNPNVIVPVDVEEMTLLEKRCVQGELDGFVLTEHEDFIGKNGKIYINAYIASGSDFSQITPALLLEGITNGPLIGWANRATKLRRGDRYGCLVGSSEEDLKTALIRDGLIAPNRRAAVAEKIRCLFGEPRQYHRLNDF